MGIGLQEPHRAQMSEMAVGCVATAARLIAFASSAMAIFSLELDLQADMVEECLISLPVEDVLNVILKYVTASLP